VRQDKDDAAEQRPREAGGDAGEAAQERVPEAAEADEGSSTAGTPTSGRRTRRGGRGRSRKKAEGSAEAAPEAKPGLDPAAATHAEPAGTASGEAGAPGEAGEAEQSPAAEPRRRKRARPSPVAGEEAATAPRPRRRRRKSEAPGVSADAEQATDTAPATEAASPSTEAAAAGAEATSPGAETAAAGHETAAAPGESSESAGSDERAEERPSRRRRRSPRRPKAEQADDSSPPEGAKPEGAVPETAVSEGIKREGATPEGEPTEGDERVAAAGGVPDEALTEAREAEQSDDDATEKRPPRRRRGGRRRKSPDTAPQAATSDDDAGEGASTPAEMVIAEEGRPAQRRARSARGRAAAAEDADVAGEGPATERSEATASAGAGLDDEAPEAPRRRRGSRGGRRSRARKARLAAAEQEALDRAAGEVAPEHGALLPEAELSEGAPAPLAPAAVEGAPPPLTPAEAEAAPAVEAEGTAEAPTKAPRKRGRRGRKAPAEGAEAEAQKGAEAEAPKGPEGKPARGAAVETPERPDGGPVKEGEGERTKRRERERPQRRDRGRPKAIVRENAALSARPPADRAAAGVGEAEPVKRKVILVSEQRNELRVALVEDDRLAEMYFERHGKQSYLGDIYRAKVENVVPGMDAAFIDFGLEKNGFLYVDEVETEDGKKRGRRIADVLRPGQEITVQVMKDPMGSKGARLTTHLSLAGRYLVYVPGGSGVGVSRRLGQSERERLRDLSKELNPRNAGLIVRTHAEGKELDDLKRDLQYLSRLWTRLKKKMQTVKAPGVVYEEVDVALEMARDLFNDTCERMLIDDERRYKQIKTYLEKIAPELAERVELYTGVEPLFEAHGVEEQIVRALERRVPLPSGGNLVVDFTEALTVIDVNSGRFTSGRSLEDTILRTNMEAAREVVRQLRLRDIGGIIVIDFIDMAHARNREAVLAKLEAELETDRTKTYVVELSPLGLVEMTRQNTTDGARGILTRTCHTCLGKARVLSEETVALAVERRVRTHARKSNAKALLLEVNHGVAERLEANGRLKQLERETKRRVLLESSSVVAVDSIRILAEGAQAHVQELRLPVREGQEVELELEFALTYSPRDAVGYLEGYMVIVEGGRPYLGEHRRVRVTATARTGASAVLVQPSGDGKGRS
jgi:ribonuclease G